MRLHEIKTADLVCLWAAATAEDIETHHTLGHYSVDIEHRGLAYALGRNDPTDWRGRYWCREDSTGIIYRGDLKAIKEWVICCSAAHHEPDGFRHIK